MVEKASCTCPAGKSEYCNRVMALLHEVAEYSLNSLEKVPPEKACTSQLRKWGVPGDKETVKEPIMRTTIISQTSKKGTQPTIYETRANFNIDENKVSSIEMNNKLLSIDKNIGFSHVIPNTMNFNNEVTKFGIQLLALHYHINFYPWRKN